MAAPEPVSRKMSFPGRYHRLLRAFGLNPESVLSNALTDSPNPETTLLSLQQCLEQPALMRDKVHPEGQQDVNPKTRRAEMSVLQQDLALAVIAPLTLRLFRDGRAPLPDPAQIFLVPGGHGGPAGSRWLLSEGLPCVDEEHFVRGLAMQTRAWYPVFRHDFGVSPGAYWSSIGLGLGAPFSTVWNLAEPQALCNLAQCWLQEFDNDANRFIDWIPAEFGGRTTAIPQRRGCCLKYLLPGGDYCGTCGVYRKERLVALNRHRQNPAAEQWQPGR